MKMNNLILVSMLVALGLPQAEASNDHGVRNIAGDTPLMIAKKGGRDHHEHDDEDSDDDRYEYRDREDDHSRYSGAHPSPSATSSPSAWPSPSALPRPSSRPIPLNSKPSFKERLYQQRQEAKE